MLTSFGLVAAPVAAPATPPIAPPATTPTGPPTSPTVAPVAAPAAAPPSARSGSREPQAANRVIDKTAAIDIVLRIGPAFQMVRNPMQNAEERFQWQNCSLVRIDPTGS
jgi:hypothetical protein